MCYGSAMGDDERREVLRALRQMARGERRNDGRGEEGLRVVLGGDHSRRLDFDVVACHTSADLRRIGLGVGGGEIMLTLRTQGEWVFSYGTLLIEATDRGCGAAFVSALSGWLGTPFEPGSSAARRELPPAPVSGTYVKLGEHSDPDGIQWERLKLFLGQEDDYGEVFLSLAADGRKARLAEKWSRYRLPLLRLLDHGLGDQRRVSDRKVVVVGEGGARFSVPHDWLVIPQVGHMRVTDARDDCCFEVSCLPFPRDAPGLPSLGERLRMVLSDGGHADAAGRSISRDRGDIEIVWAEYDFASDDPARGGSRPARERILLAANDRLQVLATFAYWVDDASWAVAEWERLIHSLCIGGEPLVPSTGEKPALSH